MDLDYEIAKTIKALKRNNNIEFFVRTASFVANEEKSKQIAQNVIESDPTNGLEIECIFVVSSKKKDDQSYLSSLCETEKNSDKICDNTDMTIAQINPRQCQYCFKTLSSKSKLNRHLKIHTEKRYFDCNVCLQVFKTQKLYDEHLNEHNDTPIENILEPEVILSDCSDDDDDEIPQNQFILEPQVIMNENTDDDSQIDEDDFVPSTISPKTTTDDIKQRYQCQLCPKAFKYSSKLARHQSVHTGAKPFQCNICQKCFTSKYSLKFHLQLHTNQGKYVCKICEKTFFNDHVLQRHQAVHTKGA